MSQQPRGATHSIGWAWGLTDSDGRGSSGGSGGSSSSHVALWWLDTLNGTHGTKADYALLEGLGSIQNRHRTLYWSLAKPASWGPQTERHDCLVRWAGWGYQWDSHRCLGKDQVAIKMLLEAITYSARGSFPRDHWGCSCRRSCPCIIIEHGVHSWHTGLSEPVGTQGLAAQWAGIQPRQGHPRGGGLAHLHMLADKAKVAQGVLAWVGRYRKPGAASQHSLLFARGPWDHAFMALLPAGWEHSWTHIVLREPSSGWHHVLAGWEACLGPPTLGVDLFLDGYRKRGGSVPKLYSTWGAAAAGEISAQH